LRGRVVKGLALAGVSLAVLFTSAVTVFSIKDTKDRVYLGNEWCSSCHKQAYRLWIGSPHSRTWVQLHSKNAMPVGLAEGWKEGDPMPTEHRYCLSCHAIGKALDQEERPENFHIEEGVQCEACHGPAGKVVKTASGRDSLVVDHQALIKPDESICLRCHKVPRSHSILRLHPWNFAKAWKRIKHGMEKK